MISIITPAHKTTYLLELFNSIKLQTHSDWEWVLYLNGGLNINFLPKEISEHPKVSIYVDQSRPPGIGYLKKEIIARSLVPFHFQIFLKVIFNLVYSAIN